MTEFEPKIVAFCCQHYGAAGAREAARASWPYPANVRVIEVPCSGRVDARLILAAFEEGADGVYVAGCLEGDCYFRRGNLRAKARVQYLQGILDQVGVGGERLAMFNLSGTVGATFADIAQTVTEKIRALGPSPLQKGVIREKEVSRK